MVPGVFIGLFDGAWFFMVPGVILGLFFNYFSGSFDGRIGQSLSGNDLNFWKTNLFDRLMDDVIK